MMYYNEMNKSVGESSLELHMYNEVFSSKIESYYLTEKQLYFTDTPKEAIVLAFNDANQYPILAMADEKLVTFFVLHKNAAVKPYSENENAILVRTLSTAFHHQGKGYAKKALLELPNFLKTNFQGIDEIVLAVNHQNEVAQGLYKSCGFIDSGLRKMGRKGELIIMSCQL